MVLHFSDNHVVINNYLEVLLIFWASHGLGDAFLAVIYFFSITYHSAEKILSALPLDLKKVLM